MTGHDRAVLSTAIDIEQFERATLGDRALGAELLGMLLRQVEDTIPAMRDARGEARWRLAHGLKGSARGLGANALADCAAEIERDPDDEALVERLVSLTDDLRAFIGDRSA